MGDLTTHARKGWWDTTPSRLLITHPPPLCCAMPCCARMRRAVMLCFALPHCACYAVLCGAMLCYASLRCVSAVSAVSELDALGSNARSAYTCETQGAPVPPLISTNCHEFRPRSD